MTRVLHIITRFIKGGADENTLLTCAGLVKRGYDVALAFGAEADEDMIRRARTARVHTVRLPLRHYGPFSALRTLWLLMRWLRRERFDIVHTHSTEAGIIGRIAALLARVPVVVHTQHGMAFAGSFPPPIRVAVLLAERLLAPRTAKIISNADALTRFYLAHGVGTPERYVTIRSGIRLARFRHARPASLPVPRGAQAFCCISRLAKDKGIEDLLSALSRVPRAHLVIVGDGPLLPELRALAEQLGVARRTHFMGRRDDVERVLAASDILALPSYREGTPRAITEAMAAGLPVVATDVGGIPEQVVDGRNGYLVPPGKLAALAARITRLLAEPDLRRKMGAVARRRARTWSSAKMVADIDTLYRTLLRGVRSSSR
jgi:glycosyltransferase involved in cell wall biosynthesis